MLNSFHADTAMIVFGLLVAGSLVVAWRSDAAAGAVGPPRRWCLSYSPNGPIRANPDMLVLPGGPLPGIGPNATDGSVSLHLISAAIFAAGFGVAGFLAQGRSRQTDHSGDLVGGGGLHAAGAAGRALCTHRASRPLDPVCDSRGDRSPQPMPPRPRS